MSPAPIYMPRRVSTFERLLPLYIQAWNQKRRQKFLSKEKSEGREYDTKVEAGKRKYEEELYQKRSNAPFKQQSIENMPGHSVVYREDKAFIVKPEKETKTPEALRTKELRIWGKEVPELRGTPKYKKALIKDAKDMRKEGLSEAELTRKSLRGDDDAAKILSAMQARKVEAFEAQGRAQALGRTSETEMDMTADAIIAGREIIDNVRNTFGVPLQEMVRAKVLEKEPTFNFIKPRIRMKSVQSAMTKLTNQRVMMSSFVKNLNKQLARVDTVMKKVISRVGFRAIDWPIRELKTRAKGSGHEKVLEAYLIEISNEIAKLSTNSQASIRELSTEAQARWTKIHDVNLSFKELKIVLEETNQMANMRVESVDEAMVETENMMTNIRKGKTAPLPKKPTVPPIDMWMEEAKRVNPNTSKEELKKYYNKKYGKGNK